MNVGSLFSGIVGLALSTPFWLLFAWQSEIDPYASRVLAKHWPDVTNLGDITLIDWSTVEPVDLICGGYPCQPFSLAGARAGTADARHLWPYFADALRHLRPRWALLENVPGHLSLGFGDVLGDLADLGYDADWDCIPAAAVGAPHLRYRIFVVAHTGSPRRRRALADPSRVNGSRTLVARDRRRRPEGQTRNGSDGATVANANGSTGDTSRGTSEAVLRSTTIQRPRRRSSGLWHNWAVEPDVGRVAHGVPSRVDRLKSLGNAVVPQVAEWVGRRIMEAAPC